VNSNTQAIVISSLDLQRIEELLELPAYSDSADAASLRAELARANILEPGEMPDDIVTMNSRATVVDETDGETREISLVYPRDADGAANRISVLAPVGSAMLGLRVGQAIDWKIPGGRALRLRVTGISYQPEASGQLHR
jgi:regulator of nucleoside diphosphate kinase